LKTADTHLFEAVLVGWPDLTADRLVLDFQADILTGFD
jgi:hypothetical protein